MKRKALLPLLTAALAMGAGATFAATSFDDSVLMRVERPEKPQKPEKVEKPQKPEKPEKREKLG
ncbi:MAG: hypothetical protein JNM82_02250 [Rhodocyclaceae bacterium]|nr:hypothetical protein [Rhodocyclaceae bacterium]